MNRIKRSAAFLLIGILALSILTGCYSTPVPPPVIPSVPSTPTEPEIPGDTSTQEKTPSELRDELLEKVLADLETINRNLSDTEKIVYDASLGSRAESTVLNNIQNDGTISSNDAFNGNIRYTFTQVFIDSNSNPTAAIKVTQTNLDSIVSQITKDLTGSLGIKSFGVGFRIINNDLYVGMGASTDVQK